MMLSRRQALALAAAATLAAPAARANGEPGMTLGAARPFDPADIAAMARARAAQEWQPPAEVPPAWREISYDQYRQIWFDTRNALWRGSGRPVQVEFFPPGLYYPAPVTIHAVDPRAGTAREVLFDLAVFDRTDQFPDLPVDETLGYSGLRLHGELERAGTFQEYCVFQGASYFRAIGRGQVYGLSARGIAVNTAAPEGEEFPEFRAFWIEAPDPGQEDVRLHALLDGPSLTGAYRFRIRPGDATVMDVEATLFPRRDIATVGLAAETSMFLYDQTNRERFRDYRPAVHDSDGLMIWNGAGERLWRPLANPAELQVSSFVDENPRGFGLMQRARQFGDFADFEAEYHRRPGLWVAPGEDWGAGAVTLVEIPTDREIYDNIVAYWQPHGGLAAGAEHRVTYRLTWSAEPPVSEDRARVVETRIGPSFSGRTIAAIDFAPHPALPDALDALAVHTSTDRGTVTDGILHRNPQTGGVRLDFGFTPADGQPMELRAQLLHDGRPVSEVWLYRFVP